MKDAIVSAILQLGVFMLIPFLVYIIRYRKSKGFFGYIGLKAAPLKANVLGFLLCLFMAIPLIALIMLVPEFAEVMHDPKSVTGQIRQMGIGIQTVGILLLTAIVKTALAEEILFRGFLAKRLIAWLGYTVGNSVQAVVFGLVHTLLFLTVTKNVGFLLLIFLVPAIAAYLKVYLNEKLANGSILPGWIAHGGANILSYSLVSFF